jgi:hypothetical protein
MVVGMEQLTIRPVVKGSNRYCGPAAISIISGIDTGRAAALIRNLTGKRMVCGLSNSHLKLALNRLGYELRSVQLNRDIAVGTYARWLDSSNRDTSALYLVSAGRHYSMVQGNQYCCSQTVQIVATDEMPHRRSYIQQIWTVHKITDIDSEKVIPSKPKDKSWLKRILVSKKAKQYGIEIDDQTKTGGALWVYPPDGLFDPEGDDPRDPYNDQHFHDDWDEVEKAVDTYIAMKNGAPTQTQARLDIAAKPNA